MPRLDIIDDLVGVIGHVPGKRQACHTIIQVHGTGKACPHDQTIESLQKALHCDFF